MIIYYLVYHVLKLFINIKTQNKKHEENFEIAT